MKKLSPKTADKLLELGYDSMEALSLLAEDDLGEADILIGQIKLLLHSLKQTFPRGQAASENSANQVPQNEDGEQSIHNIGDDDVFIRNMLGQLHGAQTQQQPFHTGPSGNANGTYSWQDPQIYLKSLNASSSKEHYDIADFVNSCSLHTERVISDNDDGQLIFKLGPAKPKLESLSVPQWSVANLAILQKLLQEDCLGQDQILDCHTPHAYISYSHPMT